MISPEGLDWQRITHDPQTFDGCAMCPVIAGGPRLVAVDTNPV